MLIITIHNILPISPTKRRMKARTRFFWTVSMPRVSSTAEIRIPAPQMIGSARGYFFYKKEARLMHRKHMHIVKNHPLDLGETWFSSTAVIRIPRRRIFFFYKKKQENKCSWFCIPINAYKSSQINLHFLF